jgi:hypothetical protein
MYAVSEGLEEFATEYAKERDQRPGLRDGQTAFNVLHRMNPDLADLIRGSNRDPFYDDSRLQDFFDFVGRHWSVA